MIRRIGALRTHSHNVPFKPIRFEYRNSPEELSHTERSLRVLSNVDQSAAFRQFQMHSRDKVHDEQNGGRCCSQIQNKLYEEMTNEGEMKEIDGNKMAAHAHSRRNNVHILVNKIHVTYSNSPTFYYSRSAVRSHKTDSLCEYSDTAPPS